MTTAKAQALASELKARVRQSLPFISNGVMGNRVRVKARIIRGLVQAFIDIVANGNNFFPNLVPSLVLQCLNYDVVGDTSCKASQSCTGRSSRNLEL